MVDRTTTYTLYLEDEGEEVMRCTRSVVYDFVSDESTGHSVRT